MRAGVALSTTRRRPREIHRRVTQLSRPHRTATCINLFISKYTWGIMAGMKRRDARALDHKTLEEIRIRAVERVQAGESPETVIQALGFTRSCIYTWLARYRSGGWGALKARALKGRPMRIQAAQMRWLYRTVTGKGPLQFPSQVPRWP